MATADLLRIAPIGATGDPGGLDGPEGPQIQIASAAEQGADLILLPQLSFSTYFPATRDRTALELGERLPSRSMRLAVEAAAGSHLFGSVHECVGEGVFYIAGMIGRDGVGTLLKERQRLIEAAPGRYEQMFSSPGFGPRSVAQLPWGKTGLLVGADVRSPSAWAELAEAGVDLVVGSASEPDDRWQATRSVASGMATAHGVAVALVNREASENEPDFAGGKLVAASSGEEPVPDAAGIYEIEIAPTGGRT